MDIKNKFESKHMEKQYSLVEFSAEEGKQIASEFDAVLVKYNAQLSVAAIINKDGTLGAKAELFKKVELVPKEQGVPTPYIENGENANESAGSSSETPEAN